MLVLVFAQILYFCCIGFRVDLPFAAGACKFSSGFLEAKRVKAVQFCQTVGEAATLVAKQLRDDKLRELGKRHWFTKQWNSLFDPENPDNEIALIRVEYQPQRVIHDWMSETWATEICSAVVSKSEEPFEGIIQLQNKTKPDENMEVRPGSRAWYLLEGDQPGHESLKMALKKVCHDECAGLVKKLADEKTLRALLPYVADVRSIEKIHAQEGAASKETLEERCAKLVVREVESETLGCCARSCGWNGATCGLWDFMNDEDKQDWKLECCAEGAILNGSFASQPGV